jgi:hypothetical protein
MGRLRCCLNHPDHGLDEHAIVLAELANDAAMILSLE